MSEKITLRHGDGGVYTNKLIHDVFYKNFDNNILKGYQDSAIFKIDAGAFAYTTDSFVVKPIFFPGGDIGKLAVCGTVNDLAAAGATPLYLSAGFVIEEGFEIEKLDKIANSMSKTCRQAGAKIVTGDTKVVEKGMVDGVYINTSGIGRINENFNPRPICFGDEIVLTGTIAEHGTAIMVSRNNLAVTGDFISDCCPLSSIVLALGEKMKYVKLMRDPTRGGFATALCEISESFKIGAVVEEEKIKIRSDVKAVHEILGTDPMYFASEGRMILVVEKGFGGEVVNCLKNLECAEASQVVGAFDNEIKFVCLSNPFGGKRILGMLENQMISRIC